MGTKSCSRGEPHSGAVFGTKPMMSRDGTRIHGREAPWLLRELTPHADWKQPDLSKHRTCQEGDT